MKPAEHHFPCTEKMTDSALETDSDRGGADRGGANETTNQFAAKRADISPYLTTAKHNH